VCLTYSLREKESNQENLFRRTGRRTPLRRSLEQQAPGRRVEHGQGTKGDALASSVEWFLPVPANRAAGALTGEKFHGVHAHGRSGDVLTPSELEPVLPINLREQEADMSPIEIVRRERRPEETEKKKKQKTAIPPFPKPLELLCALAPLALAVWYLGWVAPDLVPLPPGAKVPFPPATAFLEELCSWSGENQSLLVAIGAIVFATGLFFRFIFNRYFYCLAFVLLLFTGFVWYSISAPVERLIHNVEENIPQRKL